MIFFNIANIIILLVLSYFVYDIYNRKTEPIQKIKKPIDYKNELDDIEYIIDLFFIKSYSHIYYTKLNQALINKTPLYNPDIQKYLEDLIQFYKKICPEEILIECINFYDGEDGFINILHLKFINKLYSDRLFNVLEDETLYQRDEL